MTIRLVGLVGGLAAAVVLSRFGLTGVAAPAFAVSLIVAVVISELGRARPEPDQSGATIEVRRVRDYVKGWPERGVLAAGLVLLAGLGVLGLFAQRVWQGQDVQVRDDLTLSSFYCAGNDCAGFGDLFGRPDVTGISSQWVVRLGGGAQVSGVGGMLVGSIVTAAVALLLAALAVWVTVRAPRAGADEATRERDERWRRGVVSTTTDTAGCIVGVLLAGWAGWIAMVPDPMTGPWALVEIGAGALVAPAAAIGAGFRATHLLRKDDAARRAGNAAVGVAAGPIVPGYPAAPAAGPAAAASAR